MTRFSPRAAFRFWLFAILLLLGAAGLASAQSQPGTVTYSNQLTGEQLVLTPHASEVMARISEEAVSAGDQVVQDLADQFSLEVVSARALATDRFVVFETQGGTTTSEIAGELVRHSAVTAARPATVDQDGKLRYFLPDRITVQFEQSLSKQDERDLIEEFGASIAKEQYTEGYYTITLPQGQDLGAFIQRVSEDSQVRFAEPNFMNLDPVNQVNPNDTRYGNQWALNNDGSGVGNADADVDADHAWDIEQGDADVLVVVLDTGIDWDHPDLRPNIAQNLGEDADGDGQTIEQSGGAWSLDSGDINSTDDDGNGQTDDLIGWDFLQGDNNPEENISGWGSQDAPHGTAVAGIVAAATDNNQGVAGLAHESSVLPITIAFNTADERDAINYGASFTSSYDGVVLSNSWGGGGTSQAVRTAVQNARSSGALPVFAAGNSGQSTVEYPSRYNTTMSVGATSPCDTRKSGSGSSAGTSCDGEALWGSQYGDSLDIAAPGVLMPTTDLEGSQGYSNADYTSNFNGTSSATPMVSAAAALVWSEFLDNNPGGTGTFGPDDVQAILQSTAEKVGGYNYSYDSNQPNESRELGHGRLNVERALQDAAQNVAQRQPEPVDATLSIDRSGSMQGDKMEAAKNAASQVVRLLNAGDRVGITSYSGSASTDFSLAQITAGSSVKNNAVASINGLSAGGVTSIGGGLQQAQGELNAASPPQYPQSIILMSDGISNTAPWIENVLPNLPSRTDVYTIGFANQSSGIDEDSLQQIASQTGGAYFYSNASASVPKRDAIAQSRGLTLIKSYQASLDKTAQREILRLYGAEIGETRTDTIDVHSKDDQVRFSLLWKPQADFNLTLIDPSGTRIAPSDTSAHPDISYVSGETVSSFIVSDPAPGQWLMEIEPVEGANYYVDASAYSSVEGDLDLISLDVEQPLRAEFALAQNGTPIVEADVEATIIGPSGDILDVRAMADDGQTGGDRTAGDGVYTTLIETPETGSYSVEARASGVSNDRLFSRYDVGSQYAQMNPTADIVPVRLPDFISVPYSTVTIPVRIDSTAKQGRLQQFSIEIQSGPLLEWTGEVLTEQSLAAGWEVTAESGAEGTVHITGSAGEESAIGIPTSGPLVRLPFKVVPAEKGSSSALRLLSAELNQGEIETQRKDGSFTVGETFLSQTYGTVEWEVGWNLVSFPVELANPNFRQLGIPFSEDLAALRYSAEEDEYQSAEIDRKTSGFWFHLAEEERRSFIGGNLGSYTRELAGWALLSGLTRQPARITLEAGEAEATRPPTYVFTPDEGYALSRTIPQGEGAFIHCPAGCEAVVGPDTLESEQGYFGENVRRAVIKTTTATPFPLYVESSRALIGIDEDRDSSRTFAAPPRPPRYATAAHILSDTSDGKRLHGKLLAAGQEQGSWLLRVDPNGNREEAGTTTLSWDAEELANIANAPWTLHAASGEVLIEDMRDSTSWQIEGTEPRIFELTTDLTETARPDGQASSVPNQFALSGNYPNPFNPQTRIHFQVPERTKVTIRIYNVRGRLVRTLVDRTVAAGRQSAIWKGRNQSGHRVASGVYLYRMRAGSFTETRQMILVK